MLKLLREIKLSLIMDALISKKVILNNNPNYYKDNSNFNKKNLKGKSKIKKKVKIRN